MLRPSPIPVVGGKPHEGSLEPKGALGGARARVTALAGRAPTTPDSRLAHPGDVLDTPPH